MTDRQLTAPGRNATPGAAGPAQPARDAAAQRGADEYSVTWLIELSAASPRDAAQTALEFQRDPDGRAIVFTVSGPDGAMHRIDLGELDTADTTVKHFPSAGYAPAIAGMHQRHIPFFPTHCGQSESWTTCGVEQLELGMVFRDPVTRGHLVFSRLIQAPKANVNSVVPTTVLAFNAQAGAPTWFDCSSTQSVQTRRDLRFVSDRDEALRDTPA